MRPARDYIYPIYYETSRGTSNQDNQRTTIDYIHMRRWHRIARNKQSAFTEGQVIHGTATLDTWLGDEPSQVIVIVHLSKSLQCLIYPTIPHSTRQRLCCHYATVSTPGTHSWGTISFALNEYSELYNQCGVRKSFNKSKQPFRSARDCITKSDCSGPNAAGFALLPCRLSLL